jgi:two-component system, OmpR family, response regulator MprA
MRRTFQRQGSVRKIILLVDYDPRSIDAIRRSLSTLHVQTVLAMDGEAAEREYHRMQPDLTLVQEIIPKKRGIDLCRDLKNSACGAQHPVVLLAFARSGGRSRRLASRCDDLLEKPFDEATLLAKVRKFLPDVTSSAA